MFKVIKERAFVLSLLSIFISACTAPCSWHTCVIKSPCPDGKIIRVNNVICNNFRELQLELVKNACGWRAYIVVHCIPVPQQQRAIVTISEQEYNVPLDVFYGGQRMLIPDETAMLIIDALSNGANVQIKVGRYCSVLPACDFPRIDCLSFFNDEIENEMEVDDETVGDTFAIESIDT